MFGSCFVDLNLRVGPKESTSRGFDDESSGRNAGKRLLLRNYLIPPIDTSRSVLLGLKQRGAVDCFVVVVSVLLFFFSGKACANSVHNNHAFVNVVN